MKNADLQTALFDIIGMIQSSGLPGMRKNNVDRLFEVGKNIQPAPVSQDLVMRFHSEPSDFTATLMVRFEFEGDEFSVKCEFSWVTTSFDLVTGMEATSLQLAVLNLGARIENKYRF